MKPASTVLPAIWLPLALAGLSAFSVIAYRTTKLMVQSRKVRNTPELMLTYLALNLGLLCSSLRTLYDAFPCGGGFRTFAVWSNLAENEVIDTVILAFLCRVMCWLLRISHRRKMLVGLLYSCWAFLVAFLVLNPVAEFLFTPLHRYAYFFCRSLVEIAMNALVFAILAFEYRRATGSCVCLRERMLTAYFFIQILGQVLMIPNTVLFLFAGIDLESSYVWYTIQMYVFVTMYDILPTVLIFLMISSQGSGPRRGSSFLKSSTASSTSGGESWQQESLSSSAGRIQDQNQDGGSR